MSLLLSERPLIVQPSLVKLLGSIERAVVLQQIHWLLCQEHTGEVDEEGHKWVWGTMEEWCNAYFPMWNPPALKKHLRWLRQNGYLIVEQRSPDRWKKTNFYRIDYDKIASIEGDESHPSKGNEGVCSKGNEDTPSNGNAETPSKGNEDDASMGNARYPSKGNEDYPSYKEQRFQQRLHTETSPETSTETSGRKNIRAQARAAGADAPDRVRPASRSRLGAADRPEGVDEQVWLDFLELRRAKRAPLTRTALSRIQAEAERAEMSLGEALAICCERGWQGFRADWVRQDDGGRNGESTAFQRWLAGESVGPFADDDDVIEGEVLQ